MLFQWKQLPAERNFNESSVTGNASTFVSRLFLMQPSKYSKCWVRTDAVDDGVNAMAFGRLLRPRANLQRHHGPTAEGAEEHRPPPNQTRPTLEV